MADVDRAALAQVLASRMRDLEEAEERLRVCEARRSRLATELEMQRGASSSSGSGGGLAYAWGGWSVIGGRDSMEDTWVARELPLRCGGAALLLAVFDGHGGAEAAELCAERLPELLGADGDALSDRPAAALSQALEALHEEFVARFPERPSTGTTAAAALLVRAAAAPPRLVVANLGDCEAVLGADGGATPVHRGSSEGEAAGVRGRGGRIDEFGYVRLGEGDEGPCLAVTRAIGDADFAPVLSRAPHLAERVLAPGDALLLLASDGLFDALPPPHALAAARLLLQPAGQPCGGASRAVAVACGALCREAVVHRLADDNVTVVILALAAAAP
eukprot:tig00021122_g18440.t1